MAVTAKFTADFSSFTDAIDKAEVELADFSKGAAGVEARLNRMVDNFSGRKLIQEAALMSTAIEKSGGVATLTGQQLEQAGKKAAEAAEKMKKLGIDVPVSIQNIADAAKHTGSAVDQLSALTVAAGVAIEHAFEAAGRAIVSGIVDGIGHAAQSGARLEQLSGVAVSLGVRAGYTATQIKDLANEMQRTGITGVQANNAIIQLTRYNFELSDALKLQAAAQNSASIAGKNSSEVLGDLIQGITTLQPELIRSAGFTVSLEQEEQKWTKTTGLATTALTTHQKQMLLMNAVLKQNTDVLGTADDALATYHLSMTFAAKVAESAVRAWEQVSEQLGLKLLPATTAVSMAWYHLGEATRDAIANSPVLEAALKAVGDALDGTFDDKTIINAQNVAAVINKVAFAAVDTGIATVSLGSAFIAAWGAMKAPVIAVEQVIVGMVANLMRSQAAILGFQAKITGNQAMKAMAADAKDATVIWSAMAESLHQDEIEALKAVVGHSKLNETLDKAGGVLFSVRDAMLAAEKTTANYSQTAKDLDLTHQKVKRSTDDEGDATAKLSAVMKAFLKSSQEVNSSGITWRDTLDTIDGAVVESMRNLTKAGVPLKTLETYYGLTNTQGKAFADMLSSEHDVLVRIDAATKEAATSVRNWFTETEKATRAYVDTHIKAYENALTVARSSENEMSLLGVSGPLRAQRALEQKEQAELDGLANLRNLYPKIYDEIAAEVHQKYQMMAADAIGSQKDIIDVAHQLGLKTKEDLAGNLELARNNYDALKTSGVLSVNELRKAWVELKKAEAAARDSVFTWSSALNDVDQILSQIPGKFAAIAVVAARTGKAIISNLEKGDVVGAVVSGIVGGIEVITKLFHDAEKEINPIRQAFVDAAGGLDALNKHAHEAGTTLDQFLNAKNPEQYKAAIDALNKSFADLDAHIKNVHDGLTKAASGTNALAGSLLGPLNDLQKQLDDATTAAGKSSISLAKLLLKNPGKNDADAAKYGLDLYSSVLAGFTQATGDEALAASLTDQLQTAIKDVQPTFEHLGQYVAATFAAQIHEGASAFEAFQNLAPAFQALQDGISNFGLESTKTIDSLLKIQGVVGANKDVADSVQALSDIYDGLTQAGYLTKDLFESFAEDISHQFDLLVSRGADGTTALQLMQPELQKLWEGQQKFGDITDESTKKLLDQAEQQGLVGEDMKNVNDKILDVLLSIADVFGAKLPKSLQAMVDATKQAQADAQKALDGIHAPDLTIGVHFNVDQLDLPNNQPIAMARGGSGVVTKPTLFLAGEKGAEPFAFGDAVGGSNDNTAVVNELRGLRSDMPRLFRDAVLLLG